MNVEDVKDLIQQKLDEQIELQASLAKDGVKMSGWGFGYITALKRVLEDIEEQNHES